MYKPFPPFQVLLGGLKAIQKKSFFCHFTYPAVRLTILLLLLEKCVTNNNFNSLFLCYCRSESEPEEEIEDFSLLLYSFTFFSVNKNLLLCFF